MASKTLLQLLCVVVIGKAFAFPDKDHKTQKKWKWQKLISLQSDPYICSLNGLQITSLNGANFSKLHRKCTKINLFDNNIKHVDDSLITFPEFSFPFSLDLNNNFVEECDLSNTRNIHSLDLSNNRIKSVHAIKISAPKMSSLYLNNNQIESIHNYQSPRCIRLDFQNNFIQTLHDVVFNADVIDLNHNLIANMTNVRVNSYAQSLEIGLRDNLISSDLLSDFEIVIQMQSRYEHPTIALDLENNKIKSLENFNIPQGVTQLNLMMNDIQRLANYYPPSLSVMYLDQTFKLKEIDFLILNKTFVVSWKPDMFRLELAPRHL